MDEEEIIQLKKYFNIILIKEEKKQIDNEEYKYLYLNNPNFKQYLKNYFDLRFLKEFFNIINKKCIDYDGNKDKILIEKKGYAEVYKKLDYRNYESLKLYKVMDGFYTNEEENLYIKNNFNKPYWFSSWFYSLLNLPSRSGGISCFNSKQNVNLLVVNCSNIRKLIKLIKQKEKDKIFYRDSYKTKNYTIDILKLASCSDKDFLDQVKVFSRLNNYGKNLWLNTSFKNSKYAFCNLEDLKKHDSYFALTKSKGRVNYDFAYLLSYLNKKYYDSYFDGYIIEAQYTPYETKIGIIPEEIVIFNPYKKFKREHADKYDWNSYQDKVKFKIPIGLRLQYMLSDYNKNLELFTMYQKKVDSDYNLNLSKKYKNNYKIIFCNCNKFKSINENDTLKNIFEDYQKLIDIFKPDVMIISDIKNNINLVFKNYKLIKINNNLYFYLNNYIDINIVDVDSNIYKKFLSYDQFKKEKENDYSDILKMLKNNNADIIYFNRGMLNIMSEKEIEIIKEYGYKNLYLKNSFYLTDNFLFVKNINVLGNYLLDFNKSYYYPQLLII